MQALGLQVRLMRGNHVLSANARRVESYVLSSNRFATIEPSIPYTRHETTATMAEQAITQGAIRLVRLEDLWVYGTLLTEPAGASSNLAAAS